MTFIHPLVNPTFLKHLSQVWNLVWFSKTLNLCNTSHLPFSSKLYLDDLKILQCNGRKQFAEHEQKVGSKKCEITCCCCFLTKKQDWFRPISRIAQEYMSLWDTLKGPPPDFMGKPLLLLTVVLLRALWFWPTIPLPGRGIPPLWKVIAESWELHWKGNRDGYKKRIAHSGLFWLIMKDGFAEKFFLIVDLERPNERCALSVTTQTSLLP